MLHYNLNERPDCAMHDYKEKLKDSAPKINHVFKSVLHLPLASYLWWTSVLCDALIITEYHHCSHRSKSFDCISSPLSFYAMGESFEKENQNEAQFHQSHLNFIWVSEVVLFPQKLKIWKLFRWIWENLPWYSYSFQLSFHRTLLNLCFACGRG